MMVSFKEHFPSPPRVNLPAFIRIMEIAHFCTGRRCSAIFNRRVFPNDEWFDMMTGQSARVRIEPPDRDPIEDIEDEVERLHFEDLTFLQTTSKRQTPSSPQSAADGSDPHILQVELSGREPASRTLEMHPASAPR